jgi:hypothetical protein
MEMSTKRSGDRILTVYMPKEERVIFASAAKNLGVPISAFGRLIMRIGYDQVQRDPSLLIEAMK